jgi:hypothetical protein
MRIVDGISPGLLNEGPPAPTLGWLSVKNWHTAGGVIAEKENPPRSECVSKIVYGSTDQRGRPGGL